MRKGFTLVEVIVSLGVFSLVAVFSISSLVILTNAQKKALGLQAIQDNLRYALSSIANDIRQGNYFYCSASDAIPTELVDGRRPTLDCKIDQGGNNAITFLDYRRKIVTYRLGNCEGVFCIEKSIRDHYEDAPILYSPISSRDIKINELSFYLAGSSLSDFTEPRITISIHGIAFPNTKGETEFSLQTTVSKRSMVRD